MGSRGSRRRRRTWYAAVGVAVALVLGAAGYAAWDVYGEVSAPASTQRAAPDALSSDDLRKQVRVTITVTSDAAFAFTYLDIAGEQVERTSEDGGEISLEVVQRGNGPYLQVWAQGSPFGSFVRCRIDVNGEKRAEERTDGVAAATYCVA